MGILTTTWNKIRGVTTGVLLGRATAGTGRAELLSAAQVKTLLNLAGSNTGDQDLSGRVPYTGATGAVNLGTNDLTVGSIAVSGDLLIPYKFAATKSGYAGAPAAVISNGAYLRTHGSVSVSIGGDNQAGGIRSIAVGDNVFLSADNCGGIGSAINCTAANAWAIGTSINNAVANSLSIGANSFVCGQIAASGPVSCGVYTFATVPLASTSIGKFLRISDRAQKHCYSDGTNWRFFGDDLIIS